MNRLKKYASLLLALVMALALAVPAMAGENVEDGEPVAPEENTETPTPTTSNIIVPEMKDHSFVAYQIFSGTQKATTEDNAPLADIQWGKGIAADSFLTALTTSKDFGENNPFANAESAEDVAKVLEGQEFNSEMAIAFARIATDYVVEYEGITLKQGPGAMNVVDQGYYLIVDETTLNGTDTVRNASLLQLTKDVTITVKVDVPQVDKQVQENSDEKFGEAADYTIGDDVPFKFVSAVPDMEQYKTYKYVFHDKMDAGLTFNANSVVVTIGGTTVPATEDGKTNYTVETDGLTDGCTFEIRFEDLKTIAAATKGAAVEITFTAKLNSNAVIGSGGNKNKVQLEYSNNPSDYGDGENGKTPEDEVIVFTYELDTNKINNAETPEKLQGAEFHLARTRTVGETTVEEWAIVENGKVVRWVEAKEGEQTYLPATGNENNLSGIACAGSTLTSDENGLFVVEGLDAGEYKLLETKAPAGYNTPKEAFTVVISRNLDQTETGASYSDLAVTLNGVATENVDNNSGKLPVTIVNQSGATLPETGGIGTTIFYALGGLLTVGAVVLLVTKKRMSADEK